MRKYRVHRAVGKCQAQPPVCERQGLSDSGSCPRTASALLTGGLGS